MSRSHPNKKLGELDVLNRRRELELRIVGEQATVVTRGKRWIVVNVRVAKVLQHREALQ